MEAVPSCSGLTGRQVLRSAKAIDSGYQGVLLSGFFEFEHVRDEAVVLKQDAGRLVKVQQQ